MTGSFVDISAFQGSIDFEAYAAWSRRYDGKARIAMKATEGIGFKDPMFDRNRAGALSAGIDSILYYHFARPDLHNAAIAEANWCHSVIGAIRPQDQIILDYEVESDWAYDSWALVWLETAERLYGTLPGIYASMFYIQARLQSAALAKYPLWLANWTFSPNSRPASPAPWSSYEALQYSDKATIPGIPGTVDADIYLLSGGPSMQQYGPNSRDFNDWFTVDANRNWVAKGTGAAILGANLALYSQCSSDGNTLPWPGLPRTNELYQKDSDDYEWSVQFFERGVIVYDPQFRKDSQPGAGASYFGKYPQFMTLDPAYKPSIAPALDPQLAGAMTTVRDNVEMMMKVAEPWLPVQ